MLTKDQSIELRKVISPLLQNMDFKRPGTVDQFMKAVEGFFTNYNVVSTNKVKTSKEPKK